MGSCWTLAATTSSSTTPSSPPLSKSPSRTTWFRLAPHRPADRSEPPVRFCRESEFHDDAVQHVVVHPHAMEGGQGAHRHGADHPNQLLILQYRRIGCTFHEQRAALLVGHPLVQRGILAERQGQPRCLQSDRRGRGEVARARTDGNLELTGLDSPAAEQYRPEREGPLVQLEGDLPIFPRLQCDLGK